MSFDDMGPRNDLIIKIDKESAQELTESMSKIINLGLIGTSDNAHIGINCTMTIHGPLKDNTECRDIYTTYVDADIKLKIARIAIDSSAPHDLVLNEVNCQLSQLVTRANKGAKILDAYFNGSDEFRNMVDKELTYRELRR